MSVSKAKKHFFLPGRLTWQWLLIGASILATGTMAQAADPGPYIPDLLVTRQVSEADVFGEAMTKGQSEGILTGQTAKQMQSKFQVSTPVRIKVIKGGLDGNGCQLMFTSMAVSGIKAPQMGVSNGDYVFTNKMTLCKDKNAPVVDVTQCSFAGQSCMPLGSKRIN